ncbi:AraC-like DNA-binding protein [Paraburkholderia sp. RAU6.4a]|uniref:hypothetical protein n=1 Tax=Paraburkholderia sp. RAU6.4a TaxID=2991067 RepID=UPI003D244E6B
MSMLKVALPADLTVDAEVCSARARAAIFRRRGRPTTYALADVQNLVDLARPAVDAARSLVDTGELSLAVIARETGFGDTERMRRAFVRTLGHPLIASRNFQEGFRTLSTAQSPHMVAARLAANVYTAIRQRAALNRCLPEGGAFQRRSKYGCRKQARPATPSTSLAGWMVATARPAPANAHAPDTSATARSASVMASVSAFAAPVR